jgi:hypothetical protein
MFHFLILYDIFLPPRHFLSTNISPSFCPSQSAWQTYVPLQHDIYTALQKKVCRMENEYIWLRIGSSIRLLRMRWVNFRVLQN